VSQPRLRGAEGGVAGLPPPCPGLTHDEAIPGNRHWPVSRLLSSLRYGSLPKAETPLGGSVAALGRR
jgi:hypothetical protein